MLNCSRCRDSRPDHQLLRESLRRFNARRFARRTEDREAARVKEIRDSRLQRSLRSDDCQVYLLFLGEVRQILEPVDRDGDASCKRSDARVPRSGDQFDIRVIAAQLPGESMLPPATADDQYL